MLLPLLFTLLLATLTLSHPLTITLHHWPPSVPQPQPLATLQIDPTTLNTTTTSYTPPDVSSSASSKDDYTRIGLYDPALGPSSWRGTITSLKSFDPQAQHHITLTLARDDTPLSASFHAFLSPLDEREQRRRAKRAERQAKKEAEAVAAGKTPKSAAGRAGSKKKNEGETTEQPIVVIERVSEGKRPVLNAAVVVKEDGGVEEEEKEKTFLQKYWWALALFLVVQLVATAPGGEEKK